MSLLSPVVTACSSLDSSLESVSSLELLSSSSSSFVALTGAGVVVVVSGLPTPVDGVSLAVDDLLLSCCGCRVTDVFLDPAAEVCCWLDSSLDSLLEPP